MTEERELRLHEATLALLDRVGVRIESPAALALFAEGGVRLDRSTLRVFPSAEDVSRALASAPKTFRLYGRRTENPLVIGGDEVYVMSGGASVRVLTLDGRYESATWEHLHQFNRLLDFLPNIHVLLNQVDVPGEAKGFYRRMAAEMLIDTPKPPCFQAGDADDVAAMLEMGVAIRGSRRALADKPVFMTGTNAEPPLCLPKAAAEIQIAASRAGIACGIGDYIMMGITGPVTLAGALVQRNAVQLTALVLSQLAAAGSPFYYGAASSSANMRTLDPIMANPHAARVIRASAQLGRFYGLPVVSLAATDAHAADAQASFEIGATFAAALSGGAHLIQGPTSMMDQMMLSSFAQAVIDNDGVGYLLAARGQFEISDETLALDAIEEVMSDPTLAEFKFAMHPHTARHFREELWEPLVFSRESFTAWRQAGSRSIVERAESLARRVLAEHRPEPLAEEVAREIRRIAGVA